MSNEDLLRPTLSDYERTPGLYHSTGFFLSSFFGGPLGAVIYGGANSHRLGRLSKDLALLVGLAAVAFMLPTVLQEAGILRKLSDAFDGSTARNYGLVMRALGLSTCGAIYLMHRRFFRSARVSGAKQVSGWIPGVIAIAAGFAANAAFVTWLLKHH